MSNGSAQWEQLNMPIITGS